MFKNIFHQVHNNVVKPRERARETLPKPPEGMAWVQNAETREWKLIPEEDVPPNSGANECTVDFVTTPKGAQQAQEQQQEGGGKESPFANPFGVGVEEDDEHFKEPYVSDDINDYLASGGGTPSSPSNSNSNSSSLQHQQQTVVVTLPSVGTFGSSSHNSHSGRRHSHLSNSNKCSGESKSGEEGDGGVLDWELLSDRVSASGGSITGGGITFVGRTGSVSSKASTGSCILLNHHSSSHTSTSRGGGEHHGGHHKRTPSSSTIDSNDLMNLGPTGKGILGVDYVEHVIMPTDTLQGICLAYRVSASRLKRANHFSGESLAQAPKKLVIPISKAALRQGYLRVQDTDSKEYKLSAIQAEFPKGTLGLTEAKAYLELADWVLKDAIQSAREDNEWEKEVPTKGKLQPGEIRVMMNVQPHPTVGHLLNFSAQGAGFNNTSKEEVEESKNDNEHHNEITTIKPVDPKRVHAKAVKPEDIHTITPTHNSYGVEMQSFSSSK